MLGITALGVLMGCNKKVLLFTHPAKPCAPLYSNPLQQYSIHCLSLFRHTLLLVLTCCWKILYRIFGQECVSVFWTMVT